MFETKQVQ